MATIKLGKEPGVYVEEQVNPALAITASRLKVGGVVAAGATTRTVKNIAITRGSTDTDTITGYTVSSITSVSDYLNADGTNLPQYETADYTLTANGIKWAVDTEEPTTYKGPAVNTVYYVNIVATNTADEAPRLFSDVNEVIAAYGPEINSDGSINNLTLATRLMFNNGADIVYACNSGSNTADNLKNAIDKFDDVDVQSIVCITNGIESSATRKDIYSYLQKSVVKASATENQHERVCFVGLTCDEDTIGSIEAEAASYKNEQRVVLIAPATCTITASNLDGTTKSVDVYGDFVGAAAIGVLTDNTRPVANPLTRKSLSGISAVSKQYTRQETERLSAAGVFVLKKRNGVLICNQSVTTDTTNQNNRELSVVLIKDEVLKELRYNLDNTYIGTAYDRKRTPAKIKTSVVTILNTYLSTLIADFDMSDIIVTPNEKDSTRVDISLAFSVLRPLNYIYLTFMVNL